MTGKGGRFRSIVVFAINLIEPRELDHSGRVQLRIFKERIKNLGLRPQGSKFQSKFSSYNLAETSKHISDHCLNLTQLRT